MSLAISWPCCLPNSNIDLFVCFFVLNPKYLVKVANMKTQNDILPFWLTTGNGCDSVQVTCELPACHSAASIAPRIRCDIFSLWAFCLYLKRPTQGTLLKSAEACEYVRVHLYVRERERERIFLSSGNLMVLFYRSLQKDEFYNEKGDADLI